MIGELVKKREYSTKRGERRTRYGNTFFDEYFGMSDFQEVNPILLKRGGTSRYLVKYIMKSGEKAFSMPCLTGNSSSRALSFSVLSKAEE